MIASRKLKHYFLAHDVVVPSSYPLWEFFKNREQIGWILKWALELSAYSISFVSRSAIKLQALAEFIADWTPAAFQAGGQEGKLEPFWTVFTDGAWGHSGAGIV